MKIRWLAAFALAGCTAGTALIKQPRAQIDRPYTLPAGVDAWGIGATVAVGKDDTSSSTAFIGIPLEWGVSLADDWALLLGSRLGLAHQFLDDGRQRIGARVSLSPGFGSGGVLLAPSLGVDHRLRLAPRWAWESALLGNASRWSGGSSWGWGAGVSTGPLFQVTDRFALGASASLFLARSYLLLPGAPIAPSGRLEGSAGLGASWSLARQWELGVSLGYARRASADGYRQLWVGAGVTNFW